MSLLGFIASTLLLCAGCFASWKGALYWDRRTRDARDEDPRDQEIRELGAALSIARKELAKTSEDREARNTEATELANKLDHAGNALADIKQKFNATKEHLNREIEARQELSEEITQLRRDLEEARERAAERELQHSESEPGSELLAGTDMLGEGTAD